MCSQCSKTCCSKAERNRHIKTCNFSKSSVTRRVSSSSTPVTCEVCQKEFKCKKNLSQHMRIYKPDRYQCKKCSKRYKWLSGYRRHQTCCKWLKYMYIYHYDVFLYDIYGWHTCHFHGFCKCSWWLVFNICFAIYQNIIINKIDQRELCFGNDKI